MAILAFPVTFLSTLQVRCRRCHFDFGAEDGSAAAVVGGVRGGQKSQLGDFHVDVALGVSKRCVAVKGFHNFGELNSLLFSLRHLTTKYLLYASSR